MFQSKELFELKEIKKDIKNKKTNKSIVNSITFENSNICFNKDNISETRLDEAKREEKIITELKEKNNSDFYIYCIIKNIIFEKRKTLLSEYEIEGLSYKNALEIEDRNKSNYYFSLLKEKIK